MDDKNVSIMTLPIGNYLLWNNHPTYGKLHWCNMLESTEMNISNASEYQIALIAHKMFNNLL